MITISSQRYRDDQTVQAKAKNKDYMVCVSPIFEIDGMTVRVVLDGHHSLQAAILDGVVPEYYEQDSRDNDVIALLGRGEIDTFLQLTRMDSDWYDIKTGRDIW
jgi:hypothetical protein